MHGAVEKYIVENEVDDISDISSLKTMLRLLLGPIVVSGISGRGSIQGSRRFGGTTSGLQRQQLLFVRFLNRH